MSVEEVEFYAADAPTDLPSRDSIVQQCVAAGYCQNGICFKVEGIPRFWVKYSSGVTLGEARTQDQVAQIVNADPATVVRVPNVYLVFLRGRYRYIVMQHVAGDTVASRRLTTGKYIEGDLAAVAAAVRQLISIRVPAGTPPGYAGGGPIGHAFFLDCRSSCEYPTVGHLQAQVNKLAGTRGLSVDYSSETAEGLVLCPNDIDPSNFIINSEGTVFAIDFGRTSYMPPSFVSYTFESDLATYFTRLVARRVNYPKTANLLAMRVAAGLLVMSGNNSLGVSRRRTKSPSGR